MAGLRPTWRGLSPTPAGTQFSFCGERQLVRVWPPLEVTRAVSRKPEAFPHASSDHVAAAAAARSRPRRGEADWVGQVCAGEKVSARQLNRNVVPDFAGPGLELFVMKIIF